MQEEYNFGKQACEVILLLYNVKFLYYRGKIDRKPIKINRNHLEYTRVLLKTYLKAFVDVRSGCPGTGEMCTLINRKKIKAFKC